MTSSREYHFHIEQTFPSIRLRFLLPSCRYKRLPKRQTLLCVLLARCITPLDSKRATIFLSVSSPLPRYSPPTNSPVVVVLVGALLGFSLARIQYTFAYSHTFCDEDRDIGAAKGECYYYGQHLYKIGIKLHLYTIIPAAVLACLQFVPRIRHRVILFHRINGYLVLILVFFGLIGAIIILRRAFGGGLDIQLYGGVTVIMTIVSLSLSYYNVKKLQIDEHRKWMLRAWAYVSLLSHCE